MTVIVAVVIIDGGGCCGGAAGSFGTSTNAKLGGAVVVFTVNINTRLTFNDSVHFVVKQAN